MKLAIRVAAATLVVAAAVAGNSLPRSTTTVAALHRTTVPGPLPVCNPFVQACPTIR